MFSCMVYSQIGNGLDPSDAGSQVIYHSGATQPSNFISSGNSLWVLFTTDDSKTYPGFSIEVKDNNLPG